MALEAEFARTGLFLARVGVVTTAQVSRWLESRKYAIPSTIA
jgi:hypothetical protein